ncbi:MULTISPECIES: hypothetical protein [Acinetobacter]|jgi:hypothetical protein|uniref:hypothetical protein n=1 Tax=Acinetobacter TaxID=469 RepID=UPI001A9A7082|nr:MULTISPECIES: hypothetical protein [Acinetobacter]
MEQQNQFKKPFYKLWPFWFVFLYLLFVIIYTIAFKNSSGKNVLLASNELGDFLAGVFAPLAFLFLYLGYKQQGEELKNSVSQQTELATTAKKELDLTIEQINKNNKFQLIQAQPFFHIHGSKVLIKQYSDEESNSIYHLDISFTLKNSRSLCRSLWFSYSFEEDSPVYILDGTTYEILDKGLNALNIVSLYSRHPNEVLKTTNLTFFLQLNYTDAYDTPQIQTIKIQTTEESFDDPSAHILQKVHNTFIG